MCTAVQELACLAGEDRDDGRKAGKLRDREAPRERNPGQTPACQPDAQQASLDQQHGGAGPGFWLVMRAGTRRRRPQATASDPHGRATDDARAGHISGSRENEHVITMRRPSAGIHRVVTHLESITQLLAMMMRGGSPGRVPGRSGSSWQARSYPVFLT
jgi:hypothetical protein